MSEVQFHPGLADVPVAESAISFIDGKRARLKTGWLPGPFHMVSALLRYRMLTVAERASVLMAGAWLMALRRFGRKRLENTTVTALLKQLHQSDHACECFWFPLAIATLNEDPERASAALLAEVWGRAFFSRRRDSSFVSLSRMFLQTVMQLSQM